MKRVELSETGLFVGKDGALRSTAIHFQNGIVYRDEQVWEDALSWAITLSITSGIVKKEMNRRNTAGH